MRWSLILLTSLTVLSALSVALVIPIESSIDLERRAGRGFREKVKAIYRHAKVIHSTLSFAEKRRLERPPFEYVFYSESIIFFFAIALNSFFPLSGDSGREQFKSKHNGPLNTGMAPVLAHVNHRVRLSLMELYKSFCTHFCRRQAR